MRPYSITLCLTLALAGCGKKGPLVYPEMLVPAAPSDLAAQQSGRSLKLSFALPSKDLAGRRISPISAVTVFKRDLPASVTQSCTSCPDDFAVFRKLNLAPLPPGIQRYGNLMVLIDDSVAAGRSYTYRVSTTTTDNLEGVVSASVTAAMAPVTLPPVVQISSTPTDIQLEFVALQPEQGALAGYNIYRTVKGGEHPYLPLNPALQVGNRYTDTGLDRNTTYVYRVRSVIVLQNGSRIESLPSNEVEGRLKDDE